VLQTSQQIHTTDPMHSTCSTYAFDEFHEDIHLLEHQYDNLTFSPLGYLGHRMFQEDSTALAGRAIPFINQ
jgi:hypothetical protein